MSTVPTDLKYVQSHEWVRDEGDATVTVGITDHAQKLLGDLVFVELPEVGAEVQAEAECAVVESVKAVSDLQAPVSGEVTRVNDALAATPELVNKDPYGAGWMIAVALKDQGALYGLLTAAQYESYVGEAAG